MTKPNRLGLALHIFLLFHEKKRIKHNSGTNVQHFLNLMFLIHLFFEGIYLIVPRLRLFLPLIIMTCANKNLLGLRTFNDFIHAKNCHKLYFIAGSRALHMCLRASSNERTIRCLCLGRYDTPRYALHSRQLSYFCFQMPWLYGSLHV